MFQLCPIILDEVTHANNCCHEFTIITQTWKYLMFTHRKIFDTVRGRKINTGNNYVKIIC